MNTPISSVRTIFKLREVSRGLWAWLDQDNFPHPIWPSFKTKEEAFKWSEENYPTGSLKVVDE